MMHKHVTDTGQE